MELSLRLKCITNMIEHCDSVVDVGTDHGYIPIYLVKNNVVKRAIASDINKGPVEKARSNVFANNTSSEITCRLGGGLSTVNAGEVEVAIIAGMGGNLIRDILDADLAVVKKFKYIILQPVQNAEVLREYLYSTGYDILDEEICLDEGKFYEIIKVKYNTKPVILEDIYYEISKILLNKKQTVMKEFVQYKLQKYTQIYNTLNEDTEASRNRKNQLYDVTSRLKEFLKCF